ncbi:MAG: Nitrogen fixation-related protein [uncultured Thiotrichaceae bacterium]|uniref:Nitrogen fixation-related protein n=1 Tax=uncultured Thiotrichaceae bacterium TaxID=298394 RepID=A0A6S6TRJ3_9GAMM|nr:MAG: Nitrogen fixation-related protein [uncultured Thiotrichaceae bacterium]
MKIGVTSQNFRTITGHAGKARRFFIYNVQKGQEPQEIARLDLPKHMSIHAYKEAPHPIDDLDILITASCGEGFARKMVMKDIDLVKTSETDPVTAVKAIIEGVPLAEPQPLDTIL